MLPAAHRLRRGDDFALAVRRGRRAGRHTLVAHLFVPSDASRAIDPAGGGQVAEPGPARAGFVVSRAVGGSVTRHTVARRLRHVVSARLERLPAGSVLVIRALPAAATAASARLAADVDAALDKVLTAAPTTAPAPADA